MKKKNNQGFNQESLEMNIDGQLIAEIPNSEDMFSFVCDESELPVLPLTDSVAFPGLPHPVNLESEASVRLCKSVFAKSGYILAAIRRPEAEHVAKQAISFPRPPFAALQKCWMCR